MIEIIWKPVVGYEGFYEVSNLGDVRRVETGRVLKKSKSINGYITYHLSKDGEKEYKSGHIIVAEAFLGRKKDDAREVDHINFKRDDNRVVNLQMVSAKENKRRMNEKRKRNNGYCGIKVIDLDSKKIYNSYAEAARDVGTTSVGQIKRNCNGVTSHYRNRHFARYSDYINGTIPKFNGKYKKKASESLWR